MTHATRLKELSCMLQIKSLIAYDLVSLFRCPLHVQRNYEITKKLIKLQGRKL